MLTTPFLIGVFLLAHTPAYRRVLFNGIAAVLVIGIGMTLSEPTVLTDPSARGDFSEILDPYLIADERAFYYPRTGLATQRSRNGVPKAPRRGEEAPEKIRVFQRDTTGFAGYAAGPYVHIIDLYALSDPLLARLPVIYAPMWRIGHFWRSVPDGYMETLATGENQLKDADLALYYDRLAYITRGPLFHPRRWWTLLQFNLGIYDRLVDQEKYRFPGMVEAAFLDLTTECPENRVFPTLEITGGSLNISMQEPCHAGEITVEVDGGAYYVLLLKEKTILAVLPEMPASAFEAKGYDAGKTAIETPEKAKKNGFDAIRIMRMATGDALRLKHLQIGD